MILMELFGSTARIKILEELISNWGEFLSVDEISRMAEVSKKSVYIHMKELNDIGILTIENESFKKFKLKEDDERALALGLIESGEYSRQLEKLRFDYEDMGQDKTEFIFTNENSNDLELFKPAGEILSFNLLF